MTAADAADALGYAKPVKHRQCEVCDSDDLIWVEEYRGPYLDPNGTGYDVEVCADCDEPTGARRWVGH